MIRSLWNRIRNAVKRPVGRTPLEGVTGPPPHHSSPPGEDSPPWYSDGAPPSDASPPGDQSPAWFDDWSQPFDASPPGEGSPPWVYDASPPSASSPPGSPTRAWQRLSINEAAVILVLLIAVASAGVKFAFREHPPSQEGWRATRNLPALTVIDDSVLHWTGGHKAPPRPVGRITARDIRKNTVIRESMVLARDVGIYGRSLLVMEVDTMLRLTSGDSVALVYWTAAGDTADTLSSAQVVTVSSGRALLALRASAAPRAAMYSQAKRLGIVGRARPGLALARRQIAPATDSLRASQ
jgi:hypothetical protein